MKKHVLKTLAIVAFLCVTLAGCDLFDSVGDVSIEEPVTASIAVDEKASGTNVAYSRELVVDAATNPEIAKYRNKIKSFTLRKITFKITDYTGDAGINTPLSKVSYAVSSGAAATEIASITNFNIQAAAAAGTETELNVSEAELQKIATALKEDMAVTFYLNGTLSKSPVKFNVVFTVDAIVKAEAFD